MSKTFGQIKVKKQNNDETINLTFISKTAYDETVIALRRKGVEANCFWGYALAGSAKEALETIEFWQR